MDVYINIRNLREDNDLTQTDIANILHISQRAYSHYENGTREIPIPILINLARYYNVSVDYLLGETSTKKKISINGTSKISFEVSFFVIIWVHFS